LDGNYQKARQSGQISDCLEHTPERFNLPYLNLVAMEDPPARFLDEMVVELDALLHRRHHDTLGVGYGCQEGPNPDMPNLVD
jgi:hypothetical protein